MAHGSVLGSIATYIQVQTIIAIACLGLLVSVGPTGAQLAPSRTVYSLTVSVHEDVRPRLTKEKVEEILEGASRLLNHCNVAFKLRGEIQTFGSPSTPSVILHACPTQRGLSRKCQRQGCRRNQILPARPGCRYFQWMRIST